MRKTRLFNQARKGHSLVRWGIAGFAVATVALETVNRHGLRQWGDAMVLLEWACAIARRNVPSPAELAWLGAGSPASGASSMSDV